MRDRGARAKGAPNRAGPSTYVRELIAEGFFKTKRDIGVVREALERCVHIYPVTSIFGPLYRPVKSRGLRRIKERGLEVRERIRRTRVARSMAGSEMKNRNKKIEDVLRKATAAVAAAGVPEDLRSVAFDKAVDLLVGVTAASDDSAEALIGHAEKALSSNNPLQEIATKLESDIALIDETFEFEYGEPG